MSVSRSGFYAWMVRPRSQRDRENAELTTKIKEVFAEGRQVYGTRRFKVTTDSRHTYPVAPNLLKRQFHVADPNRYWAGDIAYIPTQNG